MTKEQILSSVMERYDISREEAEEILQDVRKPLLEAVEAADMEYVKDIMYEEFGLELDYLVDVIDAIS